MSNVEKSGRSWIWGISLAVIVFVAWLIGFGIFSFSQDVNLVTEHYYEKDLDYEEHLQRVALTESLEHKPALDFQPGTHVLTIHFPRELITADLEGSVQIYRPSDRNVDQQFRLDLNRDTSQVLTLGGLESGFWRVLLAWESGGFGYYLEDSFVAP